MKFHREMNLTALLVNILGSRNKNKHSEFSYLTSQRYLLYKFRLKKDKPWVFLSKFRCRTILKQFLLPICGKFTRVQLAHRIFFFKTSLNGKFFYRKVNVSDFVPVKKSKIFKILRDFRSKKKKNWFWDPLGFDLRRVGKYQPSFHWLYW
jgi:hypothetical protein